MKLVEVMDSDMVGRQGARVARILCAAVSIARQAHRDNYRIRLSNQKAGA